MVLTENEMLDNFVKNVEAQRVVHGYTKKAWAEKIGMSLSSYKRFINYERTLQDVLLVKNLYQATGLCCYELLGFYDERLELAGKFRKLDPDQRVFFSGLIDKGLAAKATKLSAEQRAFIEQVIERELNRGPVY